MTAAPRATELVRDAFNRVKAGTPNLGLLTLLWVADVTLINLAYSERLGSAAFGWTAYVVAIIALFALAWETTRALARAPSGEGGKVLSWIAWTVVAVLPAIILAVAIESSDFAGDALFLSIILSALGYCLLFPVLVHATGKAINASRTELSQTFRFWARQWAPLSVLLFVIYVLDGAVSELLVPTEIQPFGTIEMAARALGAAVISTVAAIADLAILVSAWRATPSADVA